MAYIGKNPTSVPLTSSDLADGIITSAKIANGTITNADLAAGVGGKVLQVVSVTKSDTFSNTGAVMVDVTGLSLSITPSSTSSKIMIHWLMNIGYASSAGQWSIHLDRDGTEIGQGDAAGSKKRAHYQPLNYGALNHAYMTTSCSASYIDAPSTTSAVTYKIQHSHINASSTFYINRSADDRDYTGYDNRNFSNVILMEIGA